MKACAGDLNRSHSSFDWYRATQTTAGLSKTAIGQATLWRFHLQRHQGKPSVKSSRAIRKEAIYARNDITKHLNTNMQSLTAQAVLSPHYQHAQQRCLI